ncbi:phosphoglycolate phosphatase [Halopenitus malekzadehii]|uniref:Phosphoglycolate phosphatase n=1 Tax=Halopenitus malekzadehii TaxID=1267564 RepID=A0A1H6IZH6_9EURY|nr:HAD-IA family hydrolase [Halopenitus malekzadehii]SEH51952.1 phosphoglycolate phosphatase [Halopenitus malekzadehii]
MTEFDLGFDPDAYDAVIYDLDGTLVRLTVDWNVVAEDVLAVYTEHAVKPPSDRLWDLLEAAPEYGIADAVEAAIAAHEHDGARESRRLAVADALSTDRASRTGVCSLNAEEACRIALRAHGLDDRVSAIVGRDTIGTYKPDPEPLRATIEALSADPERSMFVGDSDRDARTARRAGVEFARVNPTAARHDGGDDGGDGDDD